MDRKDLEDFLAAIEELDKKYNTPELALQLLQEAGIVDANANWLSTIVHQSRTDMTQKHLDDFIAACEELHKKYNTPELARQFLQEEGVLDADGKLTEYYRSS